MTARTLVIFLFGGALACSVKTEQAADTSAPSSVKPIPPSADTLPPGAHIGDTEARINSLYAGRVRTTPHKYVPGGHYMTVTPAAGSPNRIVFETDGKKVTEYRSGKTPEVEQVERCG